MGQVTSLFVHKVINEADDSIDKQALLRSLGIVLHGPVDPPQMAPDTKCDAFLEKLAALDPRAITLPMRAGATMGCDDYGAFGLA